MAKSDTELKQLHEMCKEYTPNPSYVFKRCSNKLKDGKIEKKKWFVVFKKFDSTITNEDRKGVLYVKYAEHMASELKVVEIINISDPSLTKGVIVDVIDEIETVYKVGEIVKSRKTCDISYFKSLDRAYFHGENIEMPLFVIPLLKYNGRVGSGTKVYADGRTIFSVGSSLKVVNIVNSC